MTKLLKSLCITWISLCFSQAITAARPNMVFIFTDDHAFQAVSAYGGRLRDVAPTPNIDRLAREGMRFDRCYVTNSICGPSRAVIQTGKHSHLNGFLHNGQKFNGDQQTFPKILQKGGYQTAMVGKWHLGTTPQGFDFWTVLPGQGHYYNPDMITPSGRRRMPGYVTDVTTDLALDWLAKRDQEKPFMLMLQHKAPHREWEPGPQHLHLFDDVTIPEPENLFDDYENRGTAARTQDMTISKTMRLDMDLKVWPEQPADSPHRGWQRTYGRMDAKQRATWDAAYHPKNRKFQELGLKGKDLVRWKYQRYMKDYLRCIRSVDDNVGRVLDYLDKSGLSENTVVFYCSDQGFYLGEHGWFDKRFMYEESLRTPLLVRWPNVIKKRQVNRDIVSNLDFAQTFLDIAGLEQPGDMQGASLVPVFKGKTPKTWRTSFYYNYYEFPAVHSVRRHEGVTDGRLKLIHFYDIGEWELYDLQEDPAEMRSLYADARHGTQIKKMKDELRRLKEHYQVTPPPPLRKPRGKKP